MAQNKKEKLLKALEETQGLIYHACKKAGNISRSTYYRYMREDKEFAKAVEDIKEAQIDYVETFGNENSNGNALYLLVSQWKKTNS